MNKLGKILTLIFFVLISAYAFYVYDRHYEYDISAKFSDSGPLYKNMRVYYKGYEIGKVKKIYLSKDYKYSYAKIKLYPLKPKLPEEVVAKVRTHNVRKEYIDLIPPEDPSGILLKKNAVIAGEAAFDIEAFLADIANSGLIVPLLQTFTDALTSLNKTSTEIGNFFTDSRLILKDNRQNINQTTKGLAQSTKSLNKITSNFNNSFSKDKLDTTSSSVNKSATNILSVTESVKNITQSVDCATRNLGSTMAKVDCTISEVNAVASNLKTITGGLKETLGKKFAGMRIIFGKPIKNNTCCPNCQR